MSDPWRRREQIGDATLFLGDCLDILPHVGPVDAVVTDPPYGINHARDRNSQRWGWRDYPCGGWDTKRPTRDAFDAILAAADRVVIWGGNYFADLLPAGSKWLIWDKGQTDFSLADAELAWTSLEGAVRRIMYSRARAMQDVKEHPTQKAVAVMEWTLRQVGEAATILDPYMGSATTGIACANLGRRFIGIEIEDHYFGVACERIRRAYAQGRLFTEPAPKARQLKLDDQEDPA